MLREAVRGVENYKDILKDVIAIHQPPPHLTLSPSTDSLRILNYNLGS